MAICSKCGMPVQPGQKFCGSCGTPVAIEPPVNDPACPKCGTPYKEGSIFCMNCGAALKQPSGADGAGPGYYTQPADPQAAYTRPVYDQTGTQQAYSQPGYNHAAYTQPGYNQTYYTQPAGPAGGAGPRKKNIKLPIIIGAAAAVAVIGGGVGIGFATGFIQKTFFSPKQYLSYVEEKSTKSDISDYLSAYDDLKERLTGNSETLTAGLTLGEKGSELIETVSGYDLSWLQSIEGEGTEALQEDSASASYTLKLNDSDIITLNVGMDFASDTIYMQIPDFSDSYLKISMEDSYTMPDMSSYQTMADALPDSKKLQQFCDKYMDVILSDLDNVKKSTKTLAASGLTQDLTVLTVTVDSDTMYKIVRDALKNLKNDSNAREVIQAFADVYALSDSYVSADDIMTYYDRILETGADELSPEDFEYMGELVIDVYVDGGSNIVGRNITLDGQQYLEYYTLTRGSRTAFMADFTDGPDKDLIFTGDGTVSGSKYSGDYELTYNNHGICRVKVAGYDADQARKGYLNGTFTITLCSDFTDAMGSSYAAIALMDPGLELDIASDKDSVSVEASLLFGDDEVCGATLASKAGGTVPACIPADADDAYDVSDTDELYTYLGSGSTTAIENAILAAGVPDEYLEYFVRYLLYSIYY